MPELQLLGRVIDVTSKGLYKIACLTEVVETRLKEWGEGDLTEF